MVEVITEDPSLAAPLHPNAPYLRAEVLVAVRDEGARTVEDVLVRRTRLAIETADVGRLAVTDVVSLLAGELGWSDAEATLQSEQFLRDWPQTWQQEIAATQPAVDDGGDGHD